MQLTDAHRSFVERHLPQAVLVADLSWSEALTRVLHLRSGDVDAVVKVGGEVTTAAVATVIPVPEPIVRTHGDMQPRNWLIDHGTVRLIDFGRYAPRPAYTDLVRVVHRYPPGDPRTAALLAEVGAAVDSPGWFAENLYQALATVVWATDQGFEDFAAEGRGMLRRTLDGTMVG